jgi:hypothetical protein
VNFIRSHFSCNAPSLPTKRLPNSMKVPSSTTLRPVGTQPKLRRQVAEEQLQHYPPKSNRALNEAPWRSLHRRVETAKFPIILTKCAREHYRQKFSPRQQHQGVKMTKSDDEGKERPQTQAKSCDLRTENKISTFDLKSVRKIQNNVDFKENRGDDGEEEKVQTKKSTKHKQKQGLIGRDKKSATRSSLQGAPKASNNSDFDLKNKQNSKSKSITAEDDETAEVIKVPLGHINHDQISTESPEEKSRDSFIKDFGRDDSVLVSDGARGLLRIYYHRRKFKL